MDAVPGVTLNKVDNGKCVLASRHKGAKLRKIGANAWDICGAIGEVAP